MRQPFDMYAFTCDTFSPDGEILIMPILDGGGAETKEEHLAKSIAGLFIETFMITSLLVGSLNNRIYDKTETTQYETLVSNYKYETEGITKMQYK